MLNCRQATLLVSQGLDRSLPWHQRVRLRVHLLLCQPCHRFAQVAHWLQRSSLASYGEVRLSAQARERIQRVLAQASPND